MYNSNSSNFSQERRAYVKADLAKGIAFEHCIGSIFTELNYDVSYPNTNFSSKSADSLDLKSIRVQLAVNPDIHTSNASGDLFIECSWRQCGYFMKMLNYSGIPFFKYEFYRTYRVLEKTLIAIGHSGTPTSPECVFLTSLKNFHEHGQRFHYKPFERNPAKHSPDQQILHSDYFFKFDSRASLKQYLRGL